MQLDLTEAVHAARRDTGTSTIARIAVEAAAPIIERQIRAAVGEEIAQAIEALDDCGYAMYHAAYATAARIARGHTHTGRNPADD